MSGAKVIAALNKSFINAYEGAVNLETDKFNATVVRSGMDKGVHILHISKDFIYENVVKQEPQLFKGNAQTNRDIANLYYTTLFSYFKKTTSKKIEFVTNEKDLNARMGLNVNSAGSKTAKTNRVKKKLSSTGKVICYAPTGGNDFSLIGRNYGEVSAVLKTANNHAVKTKGLENFKSKQGGSEEPDTFKRITDLGHVGSGEFAAENTPALRYAKFVEKALTRFGDSIAKQRILAAVQQANAEIAEAHKQGASVHGTFEKESSMFKLSGIFNFVYTLPQGMTLNRKTLGKIEAKAARRIAEAIKEMPGSPSIDNKLDGIIHSAVFGKKYRDPGDSTKAIVKAKFKKPKKRKAPTLHTKGFRGPKAKNVKRVKSGPSALELMTLINMKLQATVKGNMGRPTLINRTGRFAESVKIANATQGKQGLTTFYYDYQKFPYQTFENSSRWPADYDPRPLIAGSIREIAAELMQSKFRSVRL